LRLCSSTRRLISTRTERRTCRIPILSRLCIESAGNGESHRFVRYLLIVVWFPLFSFSYFASRHPQVDRWKITCKLEGYRHIVFSQVLLVAFSWPNTVVERVGGCDFVVPRGESLSFGTFSVRDTCLSFGSSWFFFPRIRASDGSLGLLEQSVFSFVEQLH